jgi:hypothetical protein
MKFLSNFGLGVLLSALSPASRPVETPEPELPPIELSHLRNLPRDPDHSDAPEGRPERPDGSKVPAVYPPAVPFNW